MEYKMDFFFFFKKTPYIWHPKEASLSGLVHTKCVLFPSPREGKRKRLSQSMLSFTALVEFFEHGDYFVVLLPRYPFLIGCVRCWFLHAKFNILTDFFAIFLHRFQRKKGDRREGKLTDSSFSYSSAFSPTPTLTHIVFFLNLHRLGHTTQRGQWMWQHFFFNFK